jgi:uncharacterized protein with NRDE domain
MCLIAFALHTSSRWPLVIAANRDEFLDRPTVPLARWKTPQGHDIISGRDLRAGGAWFGITPGGRIAFLTNVREADAIAAPRSRGELVTRWLESPGGAEAFVAGLAADSMTFAGFNLVVGDFGRSQWHWVTNRPSRADQKKAWHHEALKPGVYGLSNAALDSPWPKTTRLRSVLGQSLQVNDQTGDRLALQADLWRALDSRERASEANLPATGIPRAREEALSSAFVEFPEYAYGTRSSTLLTASAEPGGLLVQMEEREHLRTAVQTGKAPNQDWQVRRERLHWPVAGAFPLFTAA